MDGKIICDLAPSGINRRNSEGSFLKLKDGRILFAYSRYGGTDWEDNAPADVYGIISEDEGETFSKPFLLLDRRSVGADNVMSISLMRMQNEDIGLFYLRKRISGTGVDCLYYLVRSSDEGKTWSDPILCSDPKGYFVVNNDRVIRCANGRLLVPSAGHVIVMGEKDGEPAMTGYEPGKLFFFASDDDGFTWKTIARDIEFPKLRFSNTGVQEPGILELAENRIWCYIRNNTGRQYECFTEDNGVTWSAPRPSWFTAPESPLSTKRLRDGRIIAIWNPAPFYVGQVIPWIDGYWTAGRTPLVMAISTDNGDTFSEPIAIEDDPNCGYAYTAIFETDDGELLLGYCAGAKEDECMLNRLRIRKLKIDE